MFNSISFIEKKRDNMEHTEAEIGQFIFNITDKKIPEYQISAWLMAVYFNGLTEKETMYLTDAIANSGSKISYGSGLNVVDKHSTGGVGDKTTLILLPMLSACGVKISKMTGPGLGFTGGTVDKLRSIPGIDVHLSEETMREQVYKIGCAVSGHSTNLAPAEHTLYSLRDVTGTVPSIPLITSSIISKKIAGGANSFLFDVKTGKGAFMKTRKDSIELAKNLVSISKKMSKNACALISSMEQPLGQWIGNSAEVIESYHILNNAGPSDTKELCIALGSRMLLLAKITDNLEFAIELCRKTLEDGSAMNKFLEIIKAQHAEPKTKEELLVALKLADNAIEIIADRDGYVSKLDALLIGEAVRALGGGRARIDDDIDLSVAIFIPQKIGYKIKKGEPVYKIYYNDKAKLESAMEYLNSSYEISDFADKIPVVLDYIS
ncbi:MAG: thymidine phosphorylase [Synergistaceae bacterium]